MNASENRIPHALALAVLAVACRSDPVAHEGGARDATPAPHDAREASPASKATARATPVDASAKRIAYPAARRDETVADDYFGTKVADPYRWLEDPDSAETRAWVEAENSLTHAWISAVPEREAIEKRLAEVWNYERYGVPSRTASKLFYTRNDGLQNQPVWYVADASDEHASPRLLVDTNTLSKDGTVSIEGAKASPDASLFAYACSEAGSDWETIRVRDVASGTDLDDRVAWVKFSNIAWSDDGKGFYYSTFPEHDTTGNVKLLKQELRYHRLGTAQSEDALVYARPDEPEWGFGAFTTDDGDALVIVVTRGTDPRTQLFVKDLSKPDAPIREIATGFDAEYDPIEKVGRVLYVRTDLDAPTKRVIGIDLAHPDRANWRSIVPADPKRTLESAVVCGGKVVCAWIADACSVVTTHDLATGKAQTLELPGLGSVSALTATPRDRTAAFAFASFAVPPRILRHDVDTGSTTTWREPKVAFDPADYVTERLFATSKDGTRVPLFVTRKKDAARSASTPCLLYGYGGFDVPIKPEFGPGMIAWMERGGLYASAVLRGGGEYGRAWHEAGTKERKQNVFDDFIACAEKLVADGWTSSSKLAIHGRSNGGLLVGACLVQRPELFGAAIPSVGVLDMLRYDKFTIGWAWESDYGSASRSADAFAYLAKYSPLHNVKPGACYPPTLITTADHDDRVVPAHSFKFAATMQAAQGCASPILIRVDVRAGHGAGKPTAMKIEEVADEWAFLWRALGLSAVSAKP